MPKFFVPKENICDDKILIDGEDVLHIKKVLRLTKGDIIDMCDGKGIEYKARISSFDDNKIICDVLEKQQSDTEPNIEITIFQGIPKGSKMDYIIQKNTELGAVKIVPCIMSRCVVKLDNQKDAQKKQQRWQKIAEEAAKQSQRGIIPKIEMPCMFNDALKIMKESDICFAPYECEEKNILKNTLLSSKNPKTISFMIGGFDLAEVMKLKEYNIPTVTLGKRILRTETAAEAVTAMIMYEIGDINITD